MIEYTLLNVLVLELKIYCGPDKFYGRSKFGQYDEVKNRAPFDKVSSGAPDDRLVFGQGIIGGLIAQLLNSTTEYIQTKRVILPPRSVSSSGIAFD